MELILIRISEMVSSAANALTTPPVGVAYLAAYVRAQGFNVSVIDGLGEAIDQFVPLPEFGSDFFIHGLDLPQIAERVAPDFSGIIGISCMFSQDWPLSRRLIMLLRERAPHATLVAGGEHITALPEFSLQDCEALDICVSGEGEWPLVALLQGKNPEEIAGLWFRNSARKILPSRGARQRIDQVDALPWPAWDLVPMENYLNSGSGFGINKGRNMPIVASRGCPYACTFCSNSLMWTPKWIARNAVDVVNEIEHYVKIYRANNFDFYDLTAIVRKDWILQFCAELERRKLGITYQLPSGTRSEAIDEEVCAALQRTGCYHLVYAPESGSRRTLQKVKKRVHLDHMQASMKAALASGITVKLNIVMGFPEENWRDLLADFWFFVKTAWIGVHDIFIYPFTPYPGSPLFLELREQGKIPELNEAYFLSLTSYIRLGRVISYSRNISSGALAIVRILGLCFFYGVSFSFHPKRITSLIRNLWRGKTDTRLEAFILGIMTRSRRASS